MTDFILSLNGDQPGTFFPFQRNQVPEHISYGGVQNHAVHEMLGGGRVIDVMGQQPHDLEWSGWFVGAEAFTRATFLDQLRKAGRPLTCQWHTLTFTVIIASLTLNFERYYHIPYTISLKVADDQQKRVDAVGFSTFASVDDQMTADAAELTARVHAIDLPANLPTATALQKVSTLQVILTGFETVSGVLSGFAAATSGTINTILTPIKDVRSAVQQLIAQVDNIIQNTTTVGGLLPGNPVAKNAAALTNSPNLMNQQYNLVKLDSVLGRMGNNLSAVPSSSQTVTVNGGNLYALAEQHYGARYLCDRECHGSTLHGDRQRHGGRHRDHQQRAGDRYRCILVAGRHAAICDPARHQQPELQRRHGPLFACRWHCEHFGTGGLPDAGAGVLQHPPTVTTSWLPLGRSFHSPIVGHTSKHW